MVFHWNLSESKFPQASRTLLSILVVLSNVVVWMVSTRPPNYKSSSPSTKSINHDWYTRHFHVRKFFQFFSKVLVLMLLFTFFQFYSVVRWDSKVYNFESSLFLLIIIMSGILAKIMWSVCMLKSHRSLYLSFFRTAARLCIYHLFVWSNFSFLYVSQWITLPTQSCLVINSFCAYLLHLFIRWLMVSSLSPHSPHLLFYCVLFIPALIWLVLTALFCAAIRRNSVSLLKFPFLNQVQVLSCDMLFITRLKRP